ncbi:sugar transferase [Facklamia hominis]|uniref:sugar transferase n=1 Tax=Facklamia hominis TaxID=178214 RepID=UPI000353104C|nr:sugar transferase [Facklamia hominis]EPH12735.1 hypothetical protein HMPREF9260_00323 [Facklamia hominis ACS-120-V-Sch10]
MYRFIKRFFDIAISILLIPFFLILLLISFVWIKYDDGGPIFYLSDRIGMNGKIFKMIKFRTMKINAPDYRLDDGSTYNSENDPRVTSYGKFARKTSIDEFPQIINVLKGDMSIIGPRPDSAFWLPNYTPEQMVILTVRPGITGYNQAINRNSVSTQEKLSNDIYYVENMSLRFDLEIFIKTIMIVITSKNVYRKN